MAERPSTTDRIKLLTLGGALISAAWGFGIVHRVVFDAAMEYSPELYRALRGRSMANPQWEPWWGPRLLMWASLYSAAVHAIAGGALSFIVSRFWYARKQAALTPADGNVRSAAGNSPDTDGNR